MAVPLLEAIDVEGKLITADALLTQRGLADHLVRLRKAHYHFTVKANQLTLLQDIRLFFENRAAPDFVEEASCDHGQAFVIERESIDKKSGRISHETAYGITSLTPDKADAEHILAANRRHWCIENSCHYVIDWNYDEDRCRISKGYGPENISRLRRFAVGLIKSKGATNVAQKMRQLMRNIRLVLDYLGMTRNSGQRPSRK